MATFVLVHGAWHGSWCWKHVRKLLQTKGHDVFTPSLTGLADRSHLNSREVNLDTHILDIVNLIKWEELSDIVLCGHSYSGFVIAGVADLMPEKISSLIFLDAYVPKDGENLIGHMPKKVEDGWKVLPHPSEKFNVNSTDREWVDRRCTPQSIKCWQQPIHLSGGINKIKNIIYILAVGWGNGGKYPPFQKYYEKAQAMGWLTSTIVSGHDIMVDKPGELANILLSTLKS